MDVWGYGLLVFTSFFTLINPLGVMPVFMTMTQDLNSRGRRQTARKAVFASTLTIVLFAFSGQLLFRFFGISVDAFRIVGGVIFFLMGMDMLQARLGRVKVGKSEVKTYVNDISITPLAIPMIAGPGSLTNAIVLMEDAKTFAFKAVLIVGVLLIMLLTYLVLISSSKIINWLGETGNKVLMRLMGLIVMVIAVEFFISGLKPVIIDILRSV